MIASLFALWYAKTPIFTKKYLQSSEKKKQSIYKWNDNQCWKNKEWNHRFMSESELGSSPLACSWFHYAKHEATVWQERGRSLV